MFTKLLSKVKVFFVPSKVELYEDTLRRLQEEDGLVGLLMFIMAPHREIDLERDNSSFFIAASRCCYCCYMCEEEGCSSERPDRYCKSCINKECVYKNNICDNGYNCSLCKKNCISNERFNIKSLKRNC